MPRGSHYGVFMSVEACAGQDLGVNYLVMHCGEILVSARHFTV